MNENDGIYEEFTEKPMDDTLLKFFGVYGFDILTSLTENHWIHAKFCPSFGCPKSKNTYVEYITNIIVWFDSIGQLKYMLSEY